MSKKLQVPVRCLEPGCKEKVAQRDYEKHVRVVHRQQQPKAAKR